MPLQIATQMSDGTGSEFTPIVKYGSESGRFFKIDRVGGANGFENVPTELLPGTRFLADFLGIQEGWILLAPGMPPSLALVPAGRPLPVRPSAEHRQGFRMLIHLGANGGLREFMSASKTVTGAVANLYLAYEQAPESRTGKIPIVDFLGATMQVSKNSYGTKQLYVPRFSITGWSERKESLGFGPLPIAPVDGILPARPPAPTVARPAGGNGTVARPAPARTPAPAMAVPEWDMAAMTPPPPGAATGGGTAFDDLNDDIPF